MSTNQQLNFLQDKIKDIGSAIFHNQSDSLLKLPTSIVTTLKVDDYGYVWFFVQKPKQHLREFDNEFPVRLDFFRKGINHFLQVTGKGWVVTDPEEIGSFSFPDEVKQTMNDLALVKVKMMKAEYYETRTARTSWWQNAIGSFTTWFRNSNQNYRPDIYFPAS